jgi:hypothetical protein
MNLEAIISGAINSIVAKQSITLNLYDSVTIDDAGANTTTYTTVSDLLSQIELASNQRLQHKDYFNQNTIYKIFYIQSSILTGLNRNISTAGDYIIINSSGLYYKIVEVIENFNTGWVQVVGAETLGEVNG